MMRKFLGLAVAASLSLTALPRDVLAGRGGGMPRGGGNGGNVRGGGGFNGGAERGQMSHSPAMSQPRSVPTGASAAGRGNPYANSGSANNRNPAGNNPYAAGAGYANRNSSTLPNNGAAVAGASYANRNNAYNGLGASAIGAGYWNGNNTGAWGATAAGNGYGGVGAWSTGSPMYGWGYANYNNPYSAGGIPSGGGGVQGQVPASSPATNYGQPISTTAPAPEPAAADVAASAFAQARDAFKSGDYAGAAQFCQQSLAQTPNDATLHQFLALIAFAQGNYDAAAAPLYAALSTGPGWDWTTLSGFYPDIDSYTAQLRNLETFTRGNPQSATAHFLLGYQYACQGHDEAAAAQFKLAASLQPGDTLSAQLAAQYQPAGTAPPAAPPLPASGTAGKLAGSWKAAGPGTAQVALTIGEDGAFSWTVGSQGQPAATIAGSSALADGVLTLTSQDPKEGGLAGGIAWHDPDHFTFRVVGAPATDKGLDFAR